MHRMTVTVRKRHSCDNTNNVRMGYEWNSIMSQISPTDLVQVFNDA